MKSLAIVVRDDAYDRILTPLTFAYTQAAQGVKVDLLVVLWAVRALTSRRAAALRVDPGNAHEAEWLKTRPQAEGDPVEIGDFLKLIVATGNATLYGCRYAACTFEVTPDADRRGRRHRRSRLVPRREGREGRSLPILLIWTPGDRLGSRVSGRGHGYRTYRTHGLHLPPFWAGGVDAVERKYGHGRTSALCRSPAGGGVDNGALPGVRHLAQDRAQAVHAGRRTGSRRWPTGRGGPGASSTGCRCRSRRRSSRSGARNPPGARASSGSCSRAGSATACRSPRARPSTKVAERHGLVEHARARRPRATGTPLSDAVAPNDLKVAPTSRASSASATAGSAIP